MKIRHLPGQALGSALFSPYGETLSICLLGRCFRRLPALAALAIYLTASSFSFAVDGKTDDSWETFREAVPYHLQDWIVSGRGPAFTLFYTEPPPAYNLGEYGVLLKAVLRGYQDHEIRVRKLGFNGKVSDLVIQLDYGFAPQDPFGALEHDLAVLSEAIYGTRHGARLLRLEEVVDSAARRKAPAPVSGSALDLENWLFGRDSALEFFSPELGASGKLDSLTASGPAGRYLSADNSLVILLVDRAKGIDQALIPHLRTFAIDSDFVLGGLGGNKPYAVLIGRSRELPLVQFPALRVEDMVNAMTATDAEWAQSYDRTTPGAGRAILPEGTQVAWGKEPGPFLIEGRVLGDWAPSYLSADLVDTEFGSLLNQADAILKSQSLRSQEDPRSIAYDGFRLVPFPAPPYREGVMKHLASKLELSSLVFNFNTVGAGHWLESGAGRSIYAVNSTGSFSVTYSPDSTGADSMLEEAPVVGKAEKDYTDWFRNQQSPELVRTVQYMTIYQIFCSMKLKGPRLYQDSQDKFKQIGAHLQEAVKSGAGASLTFLGEDEKEILSEVDQARKEASRRGQGIMGLLGGGGPALPPMPKSVEKLTEALAAAATDMRYDANLLGDRHSLLVKQLITRVEQGETAFSAIEGDYNRCQKFRSKYQLYEGPVTIDAQGNAKVSYRTHQMPSTVRAQFDRESPSNDVLVARVNPVVAYCNRLNEESEALQKQLEALQNQHLERGILLEAVERATETKAPGIYSSAVLGAFYERTASDKFAFADSLAIQTPTIVISADQSEDGFLSTGGHNVGVKNFRVHRDVNIPEGVHRFHNGQLWINPNDAPKISRISEGMARMTDADPQTQKKIYSGILTDTPAVARPRLHSLGLDPAPPSARYAPGKATEAAFRTGDGAAGQVPPGTLVFGRDSATNRLYFERAGPDGKPRRVVMMGASMASDIIARGGAKGERFASGVLEVSFDSSVGGRDIEAIVTSFKNRRPFAATAGEAPAGGGGIPPNRWKVGIDPDPGEPRLVIFSAGGNGRKRAVIETDQGCLEVIISRETDSVKLLDAAKTRIKADGKLDAEFAYGKEIGGGKEAIAIDVTIDQAVPVKGRMVVIARKGAKLLEQAQQIIEKIKAIFARAQQSPGKGGGTTADFIIELNRQIHAEHPGWRVQWEVEVGEVGMRFVFTPVDGGSPAGAADNSSIALLQ